MARGLRRALIPQALRDKVKSGRQMKVRPQMSDAHRARLIEVFTQDRLALHQLFPERPDLDAAYGAVL